MKHTLSVLVQNEAGVLSSLSGLFSGRGYNIESLTVAPTIDNEYSRVTIVTSGDEKVIEQIVMCLPLPISIKNEYCLSYKFNYPINSINSSSTINTSNSSINNLKNNLNPSITNLNQNGKSKIGRASCRERV